MPDKKPKKKIKIKKSPRRTKIVIKGDNEAGDRAVSAVTQKESPKPLPPKEMGRPGGFSRELKGTTSREISEMLKRVRR